MSNSLPTAHCPLPTDFTVRDPAATTLTLRSDLIFTPRSFDGRACYVIEDPVRAKFFRLGLAEFNFVSLLDGRTTVAEALALSAARGAAALNEPEALAVCRWLVESHLAHTPESAGSARLLAAADRCESTRRSHAALNLLMIRVPLCNPDRWLAAALPWCAWLFSVPCFCVWCAVCLYGFATVWNDWDRAIASTATILSPGNWLWLPAAWLLLKLVHETFHGLMCKKYGGSVTRAGVCFILFAPVAFVDVTSSWRFGSKWPRILTAAAGMLVELFIAAVAAIVWSQSRDATVARVAFDVLLMASLSTLIFNGNPLMRFDGYYILADLLEIPNLSSAGRQSVLALTQQLILGAESNLPDGSARTRRIVLVYGLAALAWQLFLYLALAAALVGALAQLGVLLAAALGAIWFGIPLARTLRQIAKSDVFQSANPRRVLAAGAVGALLAVSLVGVAMLPGRVEAPAVVEYAPLTIVRTGSPGFVWRIEVEDDQNARRDQVLAVLKNDELAVELANLELAIEQSLVKSRLHHQLGELGKSQMEIAVRHGLEKKRDEVRRQIESLVIRAPADGRVIRRNLDALLGQYLKEGDTFCVIGNESAKELVVAVPHDDGEQFADVPRQQVAVYVSGNAPQRFVAPLSRVTPRASVDLPHPALSARVGGAVAVKMRTEASEQSGHLEQIDELAFPAFTATVALSPEQSAAVRAGQLATVRLRSTTDTLGVRLWRSFSHWLEETMTAGRRQFLGGA